MVFSSHRPFGTVAVSASFLSLGVAGIYWLSRTGFVNPVRPVLEVSALSLLLINGPYIAAWAGNRRGWQRSWATSHSFFWLLLTMLVTIAGRFASSEFTLLVLAIAGVISFLLTLGDWLRRGQWWRSAIIVAGSLAFSTFVAGVVWGRIYKSPLFMEAMAVGRPVHHDPVTLAAIGNMFGTYGVPSPGIDGIPWMAYHWGTPWMFAQLARLLGTDILDFYNFGYVVLMLPFLFGGILCFSTEVRLALLQKENGAGGAVSADLRDNLPLIGLFLIAIVGVFPITGMDALGVWTSNVMISESYAVAVAVALLLAGTAVGFWRSGERQSVDSQMRQSDWIYAALFLPAGILVLGYLKLSLMMLAYVAFMYAALRLRFYRRPAFLVIGALLTAGFFYVFVNVSLPQHREGIVPLDFLWGYVPPRWWPFFFLFHLFWSWLFVALRLRSAGVRRVAELRQAISSRRILDAELVALVAIAGLGPGLVFHINGGSAFYFSDVQRWVSVGLVIACAGILLPAVRPGRMRSGLGWLAVALVGAPLLYSMASNSVYWTRRMLSANVETRLAAYPPEVAARIPGGVGSLPLLLDSRYLQKGVEGSTRGRVIASLRTLAALPDEDRRRTGIFIAQSETEYWGLMVRDGACTFAGYVAPALTGMAMVDGMPAYGCPLIPYYGMALYDARSRAQIPADTLPDQLCRRAAKYALNRVMTLHFDADGRVATRVADCPSAR